MNKNWFWLGGLALSAGNVTALSWPATPAAAAQARMGVVPIYLSDRRSIAVLRIDHHPPSPVVFDTGTSGNNLDAGYALSLKLKYDPSVHVEVGDGTGKSFVAKQTKIPLATLGGVFLSEKTATVFPYEERDVVGIFGPSSFRGRDVLLDLGHGRLIVRDEKGGPPSTSTPYDENGRPAIPLRLPGMTVSALLDTGNNSALILPEALAGKLPLRGPLRVAGKVSTVTGERDYFEGDLAGDVRIGNVVLNNPTVMFSGADLANVGLPVIRRLMVMLDPQKKRSWIIEPPALDAAERAEYVGRYGIRSIRIENGALIHQRDGRRSYELKPLADDLFGIEETGDIVQFWRTNGRVTSMDHVNSVGTLSTARRQ